jgi:hypothetical protein
VRRRRPGPGAGPGFHEGLGADRGVDRAHGGHVLAAHGGGLVHQAAADGMAIRVTTLAAAARLAERDDVARIAAERGDVVAHPLQGHDQVEIADIAAVGQVRPAQVGQVAVAEHVEPVVDGHHHHVAAPGQVDPVIERVRARAVGVGAAVHIDHHRPLLAVSRRRGPDVEEQAVLAGVLRDLALRAGRAVGQGVDHARPGLGRQGGHEAARGGVGAVAHALEDLDPLDLGAAHLAVRW